MTLQEIEELAGHRKVSPWVVKLVGDAVAKEAERERDKWMNKAAKMMDTALNAQRETDAKICEALEDDGCEWDIQQQCANAIRARGQA